ncbi:hypothetical protein OPV22_006660 [Ensete ventricosum]|uniref:Uncharacterized protein n=1 Tax=Ensete ventricosum TaxID=4639 RepID=A0AAV8RSZ7_ENSVE|nr:hypothetical protein OPV22_006660 [Ensete ventricosum]
MRLMELPLFCMQQRTGSGGGRKKMMSPGFSFPHDLYLCGGAGTPSSLQNPKARRHSETTEETSALRLLAAASIAVAQVERRQWWKPLLHRFLLQLRKAVMPLAAAFLREISFRCLHPSVDPPVTVLCRPGQQPGNNAFSWLPRARSVV